VLVITGGPGVGKTTLVNSIIKILAAKGVRILAAKGVHILLAAPPAGRPNG
jgi:nucleoside-triphosphatase THEP1